MSDAAELLASARRLAAVSDAVGEAAGEVAAAAWQLTTTSIGSAAPAARTEIGALAASLRRQHDDLAAVAAALIDHAEQVSLVGGGSWTAGEGQLDRHPTPTWARAGEPRPDAVALAELARSVRRTRAALVALFPERAPADADVADVSRAMRAQVTARLSAYTVTPG